MQTTTNDGATKNKNNAPGRVVNDVEDPGKNSMLPMGSPTRNDDPRSNNKILWRLIALAVAFLVAVVAVVVTTSTLVGVIFGGDDDDAAAAARNESTILFVKNNAITRFINPNNITQGYNSCDDLKDDIRNALNNYIKSVVAENVMAAFM